MKTKIQTFLLVVLVIFSLSACGGSGTESSSTLEPTGAIVGVNPSTPGSAPGNPGLGPQPEPSNELPFNLPDDFALTACPQNQGLNITTDLQLILKSPDATSHTYLSQNDSLLVVSGDFVTPKTISFEIRSISGTAVPPATVDFSNSNSFLLGGQLTDGANNPLDPIPNAFGDNLLQGAWVDPFIDPIIKQTYIPGNPGNGINEPQGVVFELLQPGAYIFAAYIRLLDGTTQICTQNSMYLLVCPLAGFCDANGNPL